MPCCFHSHASHSRNRRRYGYYDFATPYFAAEYTVDHMNLDPGMKANIKTAYNEAGHMMYIDLKSLAKLKQDVGAFIRDAVPAR